MGKTDGALGINPLRMGKMYSVGHAAMDQQHDRLFGMINRLIALQDKSEAEQRAGLREIFPKIADYSVKHFRSEEKIMDKMGWDRIAEHKALHAKLLGEVSAMQERIRAGKPGSSGEVTLREAVLFLKSWLMGHILVVDKRYGEALRETHAVPEEMGMEDLRDMPAA